MERSVRTALSILFTANFLSLSARASLNLFPIHLAALGASKAYTGLFMNVSTFTMVAFVLIFTKAADRADKRKLLAFGYLLQIPSFFLMSVFSGSLVLLFILQSVSTVAFAISFTTIPNLALEIMTREKRASGIAIFGISGIISNPIGSFIGERILEYYGPEYIPVAGTLFSIAALCMVPVLPYRKNVQHVVVHFTPLLKKRSLLVLILPALVLGGAWSTMATFIPNFSEERLGTPNLSLYFSSVAVVAICLRIFFAHMLDRLPKRYILAFAFLLVCAASGNILFLSVPWQLSVSGALYGFGHTILFPVLVMLFVNSGSDRENYTLNNLFNAFYTTGNVLIPTLLGLLGDFAGFTAIFGTMSVIALFMCFYSFSRLRT